MKRRSLTLLLTFLVFAASFCAPSAFGASAPSVTYEMTGDNTSAELSLGGLSANIYSVQLEFTVSGGALSFEPDDLRWACRLDDSGKGTAVLYLDSNVPLNNASDSSSALLGVLASDRALQIGGAAKLTTLNYTLTPSEYASVSVTEKKSGGSDSSGSNSGGHSGGSSSGAAPAGSSTDTTAVSADSQGKATLGKTVLASAKTLTVSGGSDGLTARFNSQAVETMRALGADVSVRSSAVNTAGESRVMQAQLSGASALYEFAVTASGKNVSLPGGSVKLSIPFSGTGRPVAYLVNDKGLMTRLGQASLADKTAEVTLSGSVDSGGAGAGSALRIAVMDTAHNFRDVNGWYDGYVNTMAASGIMSGTGPSSFLPDKTMTRAELVTTLANLSGDTKPSEAAGFSDVKADDWFAPYVSWARQSGVTAGMTPTEFMPQRQITREQMAVMLVKFMEYKNKELTLDQTPITFSDASQISDYARDAMSLMQRSGIIGGKENNRVDPQGQATRAECAKMLSMVLLELK